MSQPYFVLFTYLQFISFLPEEFCLSNKRNYLLFWTAALKGEKKLPLRLIFLKEDCFLEELYKNHIWALLVCENWARPAHKLFWNKFSSPSFPRLFCESLEKAWRFSNICDSDMLLLADKCPCLGWWQFAWKIWRTIYPELLGTE